AGRRHPGAASRRRIRPPLQPELARRAGRLSRDARRFAGAPGRARRGAAAGEVHRTGRRRVGGALCGLARTARCRRARVSAPQVSVLLLTLDAMRGLPELWGRLAEQEIDARVEIVAVDSGSSDGTAEFLEPRVDRFVRIPRERFNHGTTRNLGIETCRGEAVALLVQDALPAGPCWLSELVDAVRDEAVAGAFSRQIPAPGASALSRQQLAGWVAAELAPRRTRLSPQAFASLSPLERMRACAFDNVSSLVRREVWRQHPFPETPIAEDIAWGKRVLLAGWELAYAPGSAVFHSHDRSLRYELARTRLLHEELQRLFGLEAVGSLGDLVRCKAAQMVGERDGDRADEVRAPREWLRVLGLACVWPTAQYLGVRRARFAARHAAAVEA
ncbi:MAG: glycosyltransferase, partial [Myxococcales bacterium]